MSGSWVTVLLSRQQFAADQHDGAHRGDDDCQPAQSLRVEKPVDPAGQRVSGHGRRDQHRETPQGAAVDGSGDGERGDRHHRADEKEPAHRAAQSGAGVALPHQRHRRAADRGGGAEQARRRAGEYEVAPPRRRNPSHAGEHHSDEHHAGQQERERPMRKHRQQQRARDGAGHPADQRPARCRAGRCLRVRAPRP